MYVCLYLLHVLRLNRFPEIKNGDRLYAGLTHTLKNQFQIISIPEKLMVFARERGLKLLTHNYLLLLLSRSLFRLLGYRIRTRSDPQTQAAPVPDHFHGRTAGCSGTGLPQDPVPGRVHQRRTGFADWSY